MARTSIKSALDRAAAEMRVVVFASPEGALLGSEDALLATLGVSRSTLKQAARQLESEGLLRVKRGASGGYYGARPTEQTIQAVVSAYLETLEMDVGDVATVASILWVETVRRAAHIGGAETREWAQRFSKKVAAVRSTSSFDDVLELENQSRSAIFGLLNARYVELIFHINSAFGLRRSSVSTVVHDSLERRDFVNAWRKAKLVELDAIADADPELGTVAARNVRTIWNRYVAPTEATVARKATVSVQYNSGNHERGRRGI